MRTWRPGGRRWGWSAGRVRPPRRPAPTRSSAEHGPRSLAPTNQARRGLRATGAGTAAGARRPSTPVPAETGGPYPGDGSNGPDVLDDAASCAATSPRRSAPRRRRRPGAADRRPHRARRRRRLRRPRASRSTRGTATRRAATRCTRRASRTRTTCAACSRPTRRARRVHDGLPGLLPGRWPHIHFEVYRSTAEATSAGQIAGPASSRCPGASEAVYADAGHVPGQRRQPPGTRSPADQVFGDDGGIHQPATVTGDATSGTSRTSPRDLRGDPVRGPADEPGGGAVAIGSAGSPPPQRG